MDKQVVIIRAREWLVAKGNTGDMSGSAVEDHVRRLVSQLKKYRRESVDYKNRYRPDGWNRDKAVYLQRYEKGPLGFMGLGNIDLRMRPTSEAKSVILARMKRESAMFSQTSAKDVILFGIHDQRDGNAIYASSWAEFFDCPVIIHRSYKQRDKAAEWSFHAP